MPLLRRATPLWQWMGYNTGRPNKTEQSGTEQSEGGLVGAVWRTGSEGAGYKRVYIPVWLVAGLSQEPCLLYNRTLNSGRCL